jgi:AraC-like DNA-binding protein
MREVHAVRLFSAAGNAPFYAARTLLDASAPPHTHHDYVEVMAIESGSGTHTLFLEDDIVEEALRPGQVFLFRPRDRHTLRGSGAGVTVMNVAWPLAVWQAFVALVGLDAAWTRSPLPPRLDLEPGDPRVFEPMLRALDRYRDGPTMLDLNRFWLDIVPVLLPSGPTAEDGVPAWLLQAVDAMGREENLREGVRRLQDLAHVSPAHLARTAREHFGTSPTDLVAGIRLAHAKLLLSTTSIAIGLVAERCGYASPSHFSTAFRAATKLSPREYRRGHGSSTPEGPRR